MKVSKMTQPTFESNSLGNFKLSGLLTITTVSDLWHESQKLFTNDANEIVLDLAGVSQSDSAGVALLIALVRQARMNKKKISFTHLPSQMLAMLKVSGLEQVLPVK